MDHISNDLKSELAKLLVENERQLDKKLEQALQQRKKAIGNVQWRILDSLISAAQGLSMKDLSSLTHTNDSTLTKVVDRMVSDSLVYRRPNPNDRRKIMIHNSSRGKTLHAKLQNDVSSCYNDMFAQLSVQQMHSLQDILLTLHKTNAIS